MSASPMDGALVAPTQTLFAPSARRGDFQRSRVYQWENSMPVSQAARKAVTLTRAQAVVEDLTGLRVPILAGRRTSRRAVARMPVFPTETRTVSITLPPLMRTLSTVAHEAAHLQCPLGEGHGPVFLARLIDYLARLDLGCADELTLSARASGLLVAPLLPPICDPGPVCAAGQLDLFETEHRELPTRIFAPSIQAHPMPRGLRMAYREREQMLQRRLEV